MAENRYNVDDILREVRKSVPARSGLTARRDGEKLLHRRICCGS